MNNKNIYRRSKQKKNTSLRFCYFCGKESQTVFVHGHEQCIFCKTNIEPCCQGSYLK